MSERDRRGIIFLVLGAEDGVDCPVLFQPVSLLLVPTISSERESGWLNRRRLEPFILKASQVYVLEYLMGRFLGYLNGVGLDDVRFAVFDFGFCSEGDEAALSRSN